jgi:hypothetical protein
VTRFILQNVVQPWWRVKIKVTWLAFMKGALICAKGGDFPQ